MPKSNLRQILSFIRAFGVTAGIRLWFSLAAQQVTSSGSTFRLRLPGAVTPLHLRRQDLAIFWQIMVMREYDFQSFPQASRVMTTYKAILSKGKKPVIVDCGGHVGLSAIWFATHFPEAVVYVVEPDASNFKNLQRNTEAYANVVALRGGVWGDPCSLTIADTQAGSASFRLQVATAPSSLPQSDLLRGYTVEEIAGVGELERLFIVKIDIEGAEAELFKGPSEWLRNPALVMIELHDWLMPWQGTSKNLFRRLAENNFDAGLKGENLLLFQA